MDERTRERTESADQERRDRLEKEEHSRTARRVGKTRRASHVLRSTRGDCAQLRPKRLPRGEPRRYSSGARRECVRSARRATLQALA